MCMLVFWIVLFTNMFIHVLVSDCLGRRYFAWRSKHNNTTWYVAFFVSMCFAKHCHVKFEFSNAYSWELSCLYNSNIYDWKRVCDNSDFSRKKPSFKQLFKVEIKLRENTGLFYICSRKLDIDVEQNHKVFTTQYSNMIPRYLVYWNNILHS